MAKHQLISLIKPIEATKLNPRTSLSLGLPEVTVPYGALIEYVGSDGDREKFKYLMELYACKREAFQSGTGGLKRTVETEELAPAPAVPENAPARKPRLEWLVLDSSEYSVKRAAIPGGWLVTVDGSLTFVPDAGHRWDGGSAE